MTGKQKEQIMERFKVRLMARDGSKIVNKWVKDNGKEFLDIRVNIRKYALIKVLDFKANTVFEDIVPPICPGAICGCTPGHNCKIMVLKYPIQND